MNWQAGKTTLRGSVAYLVLSVVVLLVCLFFTYYPAVRNVASGITLTVDFEIIDLTWCSADSAACDFNSGKLQLGDHITKIGELTSEQFRSDRRLAPFGKFSPGDIVPITFERDGVESDVEWEMLHPSLLSRSFLLITPLFIFGPFWLVGTILLFYMLPRDNRWRLQVLFYYLTALWLAVGLQSATRFAYSSLILHALSWLLVPVFVHFHIIIPAPLFQRARRQLLPLLYIMAAILALFELRQILPSSAHLFGVFVAFLCSIIILAYRSFSKGQSAERISARIMFVGVLLALGPGILLWIMPTLLGADAPGEFATAMALMAIPLLPLFYGYAVYKRRLGLRERRINQFLSKYALFISYLILFAFASLVAGQQSDLSGRTIVYSLIFLLAFLLAVLPLNEYSEKLMSRVAYGSFYRKDELVNRFSGEIPAVSDQQELVSLIVDEICPIFLIRQSALVSTINRQVTSIYEQGVQINASGQALIEFETILETSSVYISRESLSTDLLEGGYGWLRLAIPLVGRREIIGLWLFGLREPDDYYTQNDIEILNILARQLAITIENGQLFTALQQQLHERREAEERAIHYADRLSMLHNLDQSMLTADSPADIAQAALSGLAQILSCTSASVTNIDSESQHVSVLASYDARSGFTPSILPELVATMDFAQNENSGELWILNNVEELDPQSSTSQYLRSEGLVTLLSVPLRFSGKLLGSLNIAYDRYTDISNEHKEIARQVAGSLVLAIHNATLQDTITQHSHDLRKLSGRLITAQETERKRISYELHDEIGQILTAIMFDLVSIEHDVKSHGSESVQDKLADAKSLVEQLMGQVRAMSLELRPAMLQELGLASTLSWYVNAYAERRDMMVQFDSLEMSGRIPEEVEIALYRIFQEALTNVSRHANANSVTLCLDQNNHVITASIVDDGIGFDVQKVLHNSSPNEGVGLLAMRERLASLSGRFDLKSAEGKGTRLSVEIPLEKQ